MTISALEAYSRDLDKVVAILLEGLHVAVVYEDNGWYKEHK